MQSNARPRESLHVGHVGIIIQVRVVLGVFLNDAKDASWRFAPRLTNAPPASQSWLSSRRVASGLRYTMPTAGSCERPFPVHRRSLGGHRTSHCIAAKGASSAISIADIESFRLALPGRPASIGMGGRLPSESVAGLRRNQWQLSVGLRSFRNEAEINWRLERSTCNSRHHSPDRPPW